MIDPLPVNQDIQALAATISNPRRMRILEYLHRTRFSTNGFIAKSLQLRPSQVSKDLRVLMDAKLIDKEKVFRTTLYVVCPERWQKVQNLLGTS
jgi:DNA-binding transcriptional ArsR family regulator